MTLKDFLTSKVFFKQLAIALVIVVVVIFGLLQYLSYATNHGEEIPVPDLRKMTLEKAEEALDAVDLEYVVLDTVDFRAEYPPYTIVEQDPLPKVNVKDGRKVYVKINSKGFAAVSLPDIIQKTYRAAIPSLKSAGLEEGKKTYKPYLAKDVVLEVWVNGKKLKAGDKVMKSSKVDLVLGDGKTGYEEPENDTIKTSEPESSEE
ncbi:MULTISPECIES: PASTA domain-containing protein [Flavobacterium]|uniref:PASTA domain-containing protein n=1 Tax=Flavobacterium suzhouense TaxID=1529638 RepID=A0ABW5P0E8_9FLAO|nr:PASTA domain-containing protein [Flavobacterium sp. AG291]RDI13114.1 PASTA domain-containing protein [Flavobacterium sp. AG291]